MAFVPPRPISCFALSTNADSLNGEVAGGSVMPLTTRRDNGMVVAVASTSRTKHGRLSR